MIASWHSADCVITAGAFVASWSIRKGPGDSIKVASATYPENLTIGFSLNVIGAGASKTIIDGQLAGGVITINQPGANPYVTLSQVTIRNGKACSAGGIRNSGTLILSNSTVSGNATCGVVNLGGGIMNTGKLTINNSTISGNQAGGRSPGYGGGIYNWDTGSVTINNSTISGNFAFCGVFACGAGAGGGIYNLGELHVNNSTIACNRGWGNGNKVPRGGGIFGGATFQNSILANNGAGNCYLTSGSSGYNLSSDSSCNFSNVGDLNNTDPKLGTLGSYGGPTQTMPLLSGSPAIDAGNPNGCTSGSGSLLKTDQRGMPRPDPEDTGGCDIGAFEKQSD